MIKYLLSFVLLAPFAAQASETLYSCTITEELQSRADGRLVVDHPVFVGKHFIVNKVSGEVTGSIVNATVPQKTVLDPGSPEQSYKLIWVSKIVVGTTSGHNVSFLAVQEFVEGPDKPFTLSDGSEVLGGICN